VSSIQHTEGFDLGRYNQGVPPQPRDQRSERNIWSIKVTGDDTGNRYLWPAVVRHWTGYAAGTHTFEDWPDEDVVDIWATCVPGGDDLVPDAEYVAQFIGIHTDGYAVFEAVGAGAGAGPTTDITVVTRVCPVLDIYGAATGSIRQQSRTLRVPTAWLIGDETCLTDPANCCPVSFTCEDCEDPIVMPVAYLNFTSKTGAATCLPDSLPLEQVAAMPGSTGFGDSGKPGWYIQGWTDPGGGDNFLGDYFYCTGSGDYENLVRLWIECVEGGGFIVKYVGAQGWLSAADIGPLSSGTIQTDTLDCDTFATAGTISLGTLSSAGPVPPTFSLDLSLSWD
jgi:hypothetical protein